MARIVAKARHLRVVSAGRDRLMFEMLDLHRQPISRAMITESTLERMWASFGQALQVGDGLGPLDIEFELDNASDA